jgi:hypothetical protein
MPSRLFYARGVQAWKRKGSSVAPVAHPVVLKTTPEQRQASIRYTAWIISYRYLRPFAVLMEATDGGGRGMSSSGCQHLPCVGAPLRVVAAAEPQLAFFAGIR